MINEPTLLTIRRNIDRAHVSVIEQLGQATTCWIGDAMSGRGAMHPSIQPLVLPDVRIAGSAITVQASANSNAAIFAAIQIAKPGDIILAAAEGFEGAAVVGDVLAGMAKNKGIAALVVEGMVRDIDGLREVGLPIWALGLTPNSCSREGIGQVGMPIVIGGRQVQSGDIVVADEDGVITVPKAEAEQVLETISQIKVAEAKILGDVAKGATCPPAIETLLASSRVKFIDD